MDNQKRTPATGQLWRLPDGHLIAIAHVPPPRSLMVHATHFGTGLQQRLSIPWIQKYATYVGEISSLPELIEACQAAHPWVDGILGDLGTEHAHHVEDWESEAAYKIQTALAHAQPH
jgi:hypothetical protein